MMKIHPKISRFWLAASAAVVLVYMGCGKDNPLAPDVRQDNEVWIQSYGFEPQTLTVSVGTTVVWVNKDTEVHTVDSGTPGNFTGLFSSKNIKPGEQWPHTFSKAGTYEYYCIVHERTGKIIVQ